MPSSPGAATVGSARTWKRAMWQEQAPGGIMRGRVLNRSARADSLTSETSSPAKMPREVSLIIESLVEQRGHEKQQDLWGIFCNSPPHTFPASVRTNGDSTALSGRLTAQNPPFERWRAVVERWVKSCCHENLVGSVSRTALPF